MEMCHLLRVIRVRRTSSKWITILKTERMSNLHQWIIVIQIVFGSSAVLSAADDREHVHIKVHIPEVNSKHTHFRKIQKHYFHPKKVVKGAEFLDDGLDTTPFAMMSMDHVHPLQVPSYPVGMPAFSDIPTYGVDNTLEATIMKRPKMNSMAQIMNEGMFTKFHGIKRPSEFMGARPVEEMPNYSNPMDEDDDDAYGDDYDAKSTEAMVVDQRVAGSTYPYAMSMMSGVFKPKWSSYSNAFESSIKPYGGGMKYASVPSDWMSATTEDDYSAYDRYPSPTTMHIAKAKPLSSSRVRFEQQAYDRDPYSEARIVPKKKRTKTEKRNRSPSSGFRINY